ncbi:MAG: hypothetical protein ACRDPK_07620 [Carbonactinosporaceae bacterium]
MWRYVASAATATMLVLAAAGCGGNDAEVGKDNPRPKAQADPGTHGREEISAGDFDPATFDDSTTVDNRWFPLTPGTQFAYEGASSEDGKRLAHRVVFTVTDLTKVIDGVRAVVAWDRDYTEGELVETEIAMFAEDNDGNVWHLGQYPEEYEDGEFDAAPAWIHGLKGAHAGIAMKAQPELGSPDYAQGYAPPPINWIDRARVYKKGARTCVPQDCYDNVLVTEEFEVDKPDAFQLKYYAPGVGNVRVGWRGSKEEDKEVLELVRLTQLGPRQMADVRAAVLRLEDRAYRISEDVYARTPPARANPGLAR